MKVRQYWQAPCDVETLAVKIRERFTPEEIQELIGSLLKTDISDESEVIDKFMKQYSSAWKKLTKL